MAKRFARRRWRRPQRLTLEGPQTVRRKDIVVWETVALEPDPARKANARRGVALLAVFVVGGAVEGMIAGLATGRLLLVQVGASVALLHAAIAWTFGDEWLVRALGAARVDAPRTRSMLDGLCSQAGIPAARLLACDGDEPNATSVGAHRPAVVLTHAAFALPELEQEALLAREVSRIRSGGTRFATLGLLLASVPPLAMREASAVLAVPLLPAGLAARIASVFLVPGNAAPEADIAGALLTRYPPGMRRALLSLGGPASGRRAFDAFWASGERGSLRTRADRIGEM